VSTNIKWHEGDITRADRWRLLGVRGATMWFTGLSGSGKSTIASALERALIELKIPAYRLDGDNVRHGLNSNLSFTAEDRAENIRRVGEVAKLFADAGTVVITSFISPYAADRARVRAMHAAAELQFLEVYVDTPIEVCEQRDPKGLYKKARAGEIPLFTGVSDPYEAPVDPELVLRTGSQPVEESVRACIACLKERGIG
jgi:adenylylsulfate kinase